MIHTTDISGLDSILQGIALWRSGFSVTCSKPGCTGILKNPMVSRGEDAENSLSSYLCSDCGQIYSARAVADQLERFGPDESISFNPSFSSSSFSAPSYSGRLRVAFERCWIEIEPKSEQYDLKFIAVTPSRQRKPERIKHGRTWRKVANKRDLKDRPFGLNNYDKVWIDTRSNNDLVRMQLTLFFLRWNLLGKDSDAACEQLMIFLRGAFRGLAKRMNCPGRVYESEGEIISRTLSHIWEHFRFPEGPYDLPAYARALMRLAIREVLRGDLQLAEEEKLSTESEDSDDISRPWSRVAESDHISSSWSHVEDAAVQELLPVVQAANFLGKSRATLYSWISRRNWDISVDEVNGIVLLSKTEVLRIKSLLSNREGEVWSLMRDRSIKRESALRRLKRHKDSASARHEIDDNTS